MTSREKTMAEKFGISWPAVGALATIMLGFIGLGALQVHLSNGINGRIDNLQTTTSGRADNLQSTLDGRIDTLQSTLSADLRGLRGELQTQVSEVRKEVADFRREIIAMRLEDVNALRRTDETLGQELSKYRDAVNFLRLEVSTKPQN